MSQAATATNPRNAVPAECTERYAAGWTYANWWIGRGGNLMADPCEDWSDEKGNGFADRLKLERDAAEVAA